jgi:predicted nuclease of predicted toxin-antitoxin system
MKFKLDENFGERTRHLFEAQGHDVETARGEHLGSAPDRQIYEVCCSEERCLVTLDLDFSNVFKYPPGLGSGIALLRVSRNPSLPLLEELVRQLLQAVDQRSIAGQLWIVEAGRIRAYGTNGESNEPH